MPYPQIIDPACPLNWQHPLNYGLLNRWQCIPNPGWRGGLTLRDLARGGRVPRDGTRVNGPLWNGAIGRKGGFGSLNFVSASSQYVSTTTNPPASTDWTWTAWIRHDGTAANRYIFAWNAGTGVKVGWRIGSGSKQVVVSQGIVARGDSTTAVPTGVWSFVGLTYSSAGNAIYYLSGMPDGTVLTTGANATDSTLYLGAGNGGGTTFQGNIDDWRMWNRVLTDAEMMAVYKESAAGSPDTLNWLPEWYLYPPQAGGGGGAITPRKPRRQRTSPALIRM